MIFAFVKCVHIYAVRHEKFGIGKFLDHTPALKFHKIFGSFDQVSYELVQNKENDVTLKNALALGLSKSFAC